MTNDHQLWKMPGPSVPEERLATLEKELLERLLQISQRFSDTRFASSLAAEDMVVTDAVVRARANIRIFTLATGRLHRETVEMTARVESHYGIRIERVEPVAADVAAVVERYGVNGFYESEEARKACCDARKVSPLAVANHGAGAWVTGQRREQAVTRGDLPFEEWDEVRKITKFNPICDWTADDVWSYLQTRSVPIHPLHTQGYPSIGCEPCTRPIRVGEDVRAGRWWWLTSQSKECGLHASNQK
jgi:phosphoadenosine phosphosulfate reductase